MSTFPLVQVEGALAMPHMRPLNRVPPPFGREWSLVPSHFSLRTELHALYAAFLRTICLSAEAFRQAYRWDRQPRSVAEPPRPAAAPVDKAMSATQAQQAAAQAIGARAAAGAAKAAHTMPRAQAQAGRTPPPSHKLTASAVAIGGAALLAWIVASHTQLRDDNRQSTLRASESPASKTHAPAQTLAKSSVRLADERALHDRSISGAVDAPQTAQAAQAAAANDVRQERGVAIGSTVVAQQVVPAVVPDKASAPAAAMSQSLDFTMRAAAGKPVQATLTPRTVGDKRAGTAKRHQVAKASAQAARGAGKRHAVQQFAPHHSAPLVTTQRTQAMYSEAAEYSPHQFAASSSDEYPSVTTYATPRAASRAVSRTNAAADSTDWVNHVAQRRVTEVPDRFAK